MTEKGIGSQNPAEALSDDQMANIIGGLLVTLCQFNDPKRVRQILAHWANHDGGWVALQQELAICNEGAPRDPIPE